MDPLKKAPRAGLIPAIAEARMGKIFDPHSCAEAEFTSPDAKAARYQTGFAAGPHGG